MIIQHNIMALNAHRQLGGNNSLVSKNLEKLSSGYRINRAGDDAAGLAISEKMRAQITGLERAQSNAQDGISLVQTAEGALTEVHSMLNRMVELATQAANGTMDSEADGDRQKIQDEVTALLDEVDRISKSTNFNGIKLLNGNLSSAGASVPITGTVAGAAVSGTPVAASKSEYVTGAFTQTGTTGSVSMSVTVSYTDANGNDLEELVSFSSGADADATAANMLTAFEGNTKLSGLFDITELGEAFTFAAKDAGAGKGAVTEVKITTAGTGDVLSGGAKASSADGANATTAYNLTGWTTGDAISVGGKEYTYADYNNYSDLQGALSADGYTLGGTQAAATVSSASVGGLTLQIGDTADDFNKVIVSVEDMSTEGLGINGLDVSTEAKAADAIDTIKAAINKVSTNRSGLGALQNRLEHTINNLGVTTENMTSAESRIRDVDMAKEMMDFTKNNVLTQAAQAMLAQANQQPQQVLQLLQ